MLSTKVSHFAKRPLSQKMNDQISWDLSLVKKYSCSNHFKLLNQLRNELKKYPLNKKKNTSSKTINDSNIVNRDNLNITTSKDISYSKQTYSNKVDNNNTNVSFNNSKNFSIYKHTSIENNRKQLDTNLFEVKNINEEKSTSTFKDRLNQIDMK